MKSKLYLLLILCATMFLGSCGSEEVVDNRWQLDNEAQFARITMDPAFTKRESLTNNGHIMYRVIRSGDPNGVRPLSNERVSVNYTGWFKNDWTKPDTFVNEQGRTITNRIVFDTTIDDRGNARPRPLYVYRQIHGFSDALQHMRPGDKWEVWIPWSLAFGRHQHHAIRGFTTLVFEIELLSVLPPS